MTQGGSQSALEAELLAQIRMAGLPEPVTQHRFAKPRRWKADLCWPDDGKLMVEVDGGTWVGGRHNRGAGMRGDCEKLGEAAALGWVVVRVTGDMVRDGTALNLVRRVFEQLSRSTEA